MFGAFCDLLHTVACKKKLAISISVIRKLALIFIPVEIQNSIDKWSGRPGNLP